MQVHVHKSRFRFSASLPTGSKVDIRSLNKNLAHQRFWHHQTIHARIGIIFRDERERYGLVLSCTSCALKFFQGCFLRFSRLRINCDGCIFWGGCVCFLLFPSVASRAFKDIISALLASPKFRDSAQVRPCRSKNVNHIHACPPSPSACGPYSFSHRPTSLARFARSKRDSWAEDFQEKVERVFLKGISQSSATDFGSKD